jgi:two-component system, NarL family, sensor histidine kinase DegS
MATDSAPEQPAAGDLKVEVSAEAARLTAELTEIDMLIAQARVEAVRHEQKREQAVAKLSSVAPTTEPAQILQLSNQAVALTKRAALMEAQVEVLEGKRRTLARFRDSLERVAQALPEGVAVSTEASAASSAAAAGARAERHREEAGSRAAAASRAVLSAQEELRREIARAMHDGPAQSLTNIVLQAQIVERLVARDPASARGELRELMSMVQQTLDATKTFIFDVRPMVLDDLGLLPTLRRAARDRSRRARLPVHFESLGADRRLSSEMESGLFRILDDGLAAYLSVEPGQLELRLDWTDQLEIRLAAAPRGGTTARSEAGTAEPAPGPSPAGRTAVSGAGQEDLPPALAAMMQDRAEDQRRAVEAARVAAVSALPPASWEEIRARAAALGVTAELLAEGAELRLVVDLATAGGPA